MSVTTTLPAALTSLNRREPVDPAYLATWSNAITGDAGGGTATIGVTVPIDFAVVPLYMTAHNDAADLIVQFLILTGGLGTLGNQVELAAGLAGETRWSWSVPKAFIVPLIGQQVEFRTITANPGAATNMDAAGRALLWPRNEILALPYTTFWPYLQG